MSSSLPSSSAQRFTSGEAQDQPADSLTKRREFFDGYAEWTLNKKGNIVSFELFPEHFTPRRLTVDYRARTAKYGDGWGYFSLYRRGWSEEIILSHVARVQEKVSIHDWVDSMFAELLRRGVSSGLEAFLIWVGSRWDALQSEQNTEDFESCLESITWTLELRGIRVEEASAVEQVAWCFCAGRLGVETARVAVLFPDAWRQVEAQFGAYRELFERVMGRGFGVHSA